MLFVCSTVCLHAKNPYPKKDWAISKSFKTQMTEKQYTNKTMLRMRTIFTYINTSIAQHVKTRIKLKICFVFLKFPNLGGLKKKNKKKKIYVSFLTLKMPHCPSL